MADIFTPPVPPQEEPQVENTFSAREIRFGEGYVQDFGVGIPGHTKEQKWPLLFVGTNEEIDPIVDFFDAHQGHIRFQYTPPGKTAMLFVVKSYQYIPSSGGNAKVSAVFEQRFAE